MQTAFSILSDEDVLRRVAGGEAAAYAELYRRYALVHDQAAFSGMDRCS